MKTIFVSSCHGCGVTLATCCVKPGSEEDIGTIVMRGVDRGSVEFSIRHDVPVRFDSCTCIPGQPTKRQQVEAAEQGAVAIATERGIVYRRM